MPSSNYSNDIENFEFIDNELNQETSLFEEFINKTKNELYRNDVNSNNELIVQAPILDTPISNSDEKIKISVWFSNKQKQLMEYVNNYNIDCLIKNIVASSTKHFGKHNICKYMLKIHGREEYFPLNAHLFDLKYIRNCLSMNISPSFCLTKVEATNKQNIFKRISFKLNLHAKSDFSFKLDRKSYNLMKQPQLEEVLDAIHENYKLIKKAVKECDKAFLLSVCETFRKNFKELPSKVLNIKYAPFINYTELMKEKEKTIRDNQSKFINSKDSNALLIVVYSLMRSCIKFFNCASTSFYWPVKLKKTLTEKQKVNNLSFSKEKIRLGVESLSNLLDLMSNIELK